MQTDWINRLGKWRTILAGWQLGTRAKGDPESDAVRDHRELSLMLRADLNALTALLINKGVFTSDEYAEAFNEECRLMNIDMEKRFPGVKATDDGLTIDPVKASPWMSKFPK